MITPTLRRVLIGLIAIAITLITSMAAAQEVIATVDRSSINPEETLRFEIVVQGTTNVQIESPQCADFQTIRRSASSMTQIVNGRTNSSSTTHFTMSPMRVGTLEICSVRVVSEFGVVQTAPISIEVSASPSRNPGTTVTVPVLPQQPGNPLARPPNAPASWVAPAPAPGSVEMFGPDITSDVIGRPFVVAQVSDADPYVGQPFIVDYLLMIPASELGISGTGLTEPEFEGFWFTDISEQRSRPRNLGTRTIGGEMYTTQTGRSYLVVPLESGDRVVPPFGLTLQRSGFRRNQATLEIASSAVHLPVAAQPDEGRPAGFRPGNVGRFELLAELERSAARVGDSVRLLVRVHGTGLMTNVRIPDVPEVEGLRFYDPDITTDQNVSGFDWIQGHTQAAIQVVAEAEGTYTIPALTYTYFDPWTEEYATATSEPLTLIIQGINPNAMLETNQGDADADRALQLPGPRALTRLKQGQGYRLSPLYLALLLLPVGLLFGAIGKDRRDAKRTADAPNQARRQAGAVAMAAIAEATSTSDIATAVRSYLETKLKRPVRGETVDGVRDIVSVSFNAELAEIVCDVLTNADLARYGGGGSLDATRAKANSVVQGMEAAQ